MSHSQKPTFQGLNQQVFSPQACSVTMVTPGGLAISHLHGQQMGFRLYM